MSKVMNEQLVRVMEEAAEVVQAASKCYLFGWHHDEPGYGVNSEKLAEEIGDLLGVLDLLPIKWEIVDVARRAKPEKIQKYMERPFGTLLPTSGVHGTNDEGWNPSE